MGQPVIDLADAATRPLTQVGAKARTLGRLAAHGLPVPDGVVVPPDVADSDLGSVAAALDERFGDVPLAVRSSADVEDGARTSWAGLLHTELRVRGDGVVGAIRRVRDSGAGTQPVAMAVLVMPMVDADAAGVAFTADPVSGDTGTTVVEAVTGTAEGLVDGSRTPSRWVVAADGTSGRAVGDPLVDDEVVHAVARLAREAADRLGLPVDVEWAVHDGAVQLLQARPITTLPATLRGADLVPAGTWVRDAAHFPVPLSRLGASVLCPAVADGLSRAFRAAGTGLDRCECRTVDHWFYVRFVPAGVPERALAAGAAPPPPLVLGALWRLHPALRAHARAARDYLSSGAAEQTLAARVDGIPEELVDGLDDVQTADLVRAADAELGRLAATCRSVVDRSWRGHGEFAAAMNVLMGRLVTRAGRALGWSPQQCNALLDGHGGATRHASDDLAPVREALATDPDAHAAVLAGDARALLDGTGPAAVAFRHYLDRHGDVPLAVDVAAPTLREAPETVLPSLTTTPTPPMPHPEASELEAALRAHREASELGEALDLARRGHGLRDQDSLPTLWALGQLRRVALEVGRRLVDRDAADHAEDAFHLDVDELLAWSRGEPAPPRDALRRRRADFERAHGVRPPDVLGPPPVAPPPPRFLPPAAREVATCVGAAMGLMGTTPVAGRGPDAPEGTWVGTPASPGSHTGVVRVVRSPRDLARLAPGDVLVCQLTTVAWAPAFERAGAVVTEAGGVLSHPAIQAREHGLPAVVGIVDATTTLRDGETATVDGTAGTVTRRAATVDPTGVAFEFGAHAAAQALSAAAVLDAAADAGIWQAIEGSAATPHEVAAATDTDPAGVAVVLRALTSLGVAERLDDGRVRATQDLTAYRGALARRAVLVDQLRDPGSGRPATYEVVAAPLGEALGRPVAPRVREVLGEARRVLDLGAGTAPYTRPLAVGSPDVEIVAVDSAPVLAAMRRAVDRDGVGDQVRAVPGDLFSVELPTDRDLVVVANVLHLFDDDDCRRLLERAVATLAPGGRLAIIEPLPDETMDGPTMVALYAVGLWVRAPRGGVRPFTTYAAWLRELGLVDVTPHELGHAHLVCITGRA